MDDLQSTRHSILNYLYGKITTKRTAQLHRSTISNVNKNENENADIVHINNIFNIKCMKDDYNAIEQFLQNIYNNNIEIINLFDNLNIVVKPTYHYDNVRTYTYTFYDKLNENKLKIKWNNNTDYNLQSIYNIVRCILKYIDYQHLNLDIRTDPINNKNIVGFMTKPVGFMFNGDHTDILEVRHEGKILCDDEIYLILRQYRTVGKNTKIAIRS